jgi:DNA polymerase III epsilon subunit-like protein
MNNGILVLLMILILGSSTLLLFHSAEFDRGFRAECTAAGGTAVMPRGSKYICVDTMNIIELNNR